MTLFFDVYVQICLGATAVQVLTSVLFNGPASISLMNAELVDLLERDEHESVSAAIASYHEDVVRDCGGRRSSIV